MTAPVELERVDVIVAGEIAVPHAYVFRPPGGNRVSRLAALARPKERPIRTPLLAFVLTHPTAGRILVDTGLHPDAATDLRGDYGTFLAGVFRALRPADRSFPEQLAELGIDPAAIELVVMTHLHVDHTGGMRLMPRAEFVCSTPEWAAATGPRPFLGGYAPDHLPPAGRMRLIDVEREGSPHGPFAASIDLLGDGSVRLLSTPGHTRGHVSVLLRVAPGRQVLLVGDAAYTLESIGRQALPMFTTGDERYRESLAALNAFAASEPEAVLVPTHDPDAWRAIS